jgi:hypothetical protein
LDDLYLLSAFTQVLRIKFARTPSANLRWQVLGIQGSAEELARELKRFLAGEASLAAAETVRIMSAVGEEYPARRRNPPVAVCRRRNA